jgi:hypothetical protein
VCEVQSYVVEGGTDRPSPGFAGSSPEVDTNIRCSETSDIKHHKPGNNPKDYTRY